MARKKDKEPVENPETIVSDETKIESTKPAPDEYTINSVPGIVIKLNNREVIWRLPSGKLELNCMKSNGTTVKVPTGLSEDEYQQIVESLRLGTIYEVDALEAFEPKRATPVVPYPASVQVYRLLDIRDFAKFGDAVRKTHNMPFLEACLAVEKTEKARKEYIETLVDKLKELAG